MSEAGGAAGRAAGIVSAAAIGAAAVMTAAMAAAVIFTVGDRFLLGRTPAWSEEVPRLLMIWAVFLGVAHAGWRRTHLRAGLLELWAGPRLERALRFAADLLCVGFLVLVGWTATEMAALTHSTITPALEFSAAVFYAPIAIGAGIAAPVMLVRAVLDLRHGPQG